VHALAPTLDHVPALQVEHDSALGAPTVEDAVPALQFVQLVDPNAE
jgi:hypothetical protein